MIRKEQECKIEYREHMRDGDGTVQITNFITGPAELNEKGRLFAKITLNPGCSIGYHLHDKDVCTKTTNTQQSAWQVLYPPTVKP